MSHYTVAPAYGRDYKSAAAAIKDFREGKDFTMMGFQGSGYCSVRDFKPGHKINIRYSQMRKVTIYNVTGTECE